MAKIHYIWLDFENASGSVHSTLVYNGEMEATTAAKAMDKISNEQLMKLKPRWMEDVRNIYLFAQNINGEVRHGVTRHL